MHRIPSLPAAYSVVLSGLGLGLSFPPFPFPILAWICLIPLILRWLTTPSVRTCWLEAYGAFSIAYLVAGYWVAFHPFPSTAVVSVAGLLTLPLFHALPFALSVPVRRAWGSVVGAAALGVFYLTFELGLHRSAFAFPWLLLGHSQASFIHFNQTADTTGVLGLSATVLLLNFLATAGLRARSRTRGVVSLGLIGLVVLASLGYSRYRLAHSPRPTGSLRMGLVQPSLSVLEWADVSSTARVDTLQRLSERLLEAGPPLDVLVWPETALPVGSTFEAQALLEDRIRGWVQRHGVPLLTGAIRPDFDALKRVGYSNTVLLVTPHYIRHYDKQRLVPFAEAVPYADVVPWLHHLAVPAGGVSGYIPGRTPPVLRLGSTMIGPLVCFESVFANQARRAVQAGAEVLVVLAQDGWWGPSAGYRQHLAFNRLRAVETRRTLVQVTATGTTAVVEPTGNLSLETRWMERTARTAEVSLYRTPTPYVRWGDWVGWLSFAASLGFGGAFFLRRLRRPRPPENAA